LAALTPPSSPASPPGHRARVKSKLPPTRI